MSYCGEYKRRMSSWNGLKNGINYVARAKMRYRKIPKISPWAFIFQRPFLRGLFLEGIIYGGKFSFQNWPGLYWEGNLRFNIEWAGL